MAAEADLIVGGIEAAVVEHQLAFTIALEAGARDHVEHSIGTVAELGRIAAALHFDGINVFGIELRANIAGDIGIGNGHAVDQPAHLVPTADMQLRVHDGGAGNVIGDHRQAVGLLRAWRAANLLAVEQRLR